MVSKTHNEAGAPPTSGTPVPAAGRARRLPANLTQGFRALAVRNYRLFWIGQLISLCGTWMQATAQAWLVLQLTKSPLALGLVTTFQSLPIMLLSLFGGAIADRLPKYRLILITQAAALVQAAILGVLVGTGSVQLWHIYGLALVLGVINAIDTPTRQAFVSELVGREHLPSAVALNSMLFNGARIIGPVVAGLLISQLGIAPAFYLNALSFIGVLTGLLMMDRSRFRALTAQPKGSMLHGIAEGLTYTWRTPAVMAIMIMIAFIGTFGYNFNVVLPLISGFVLHTDATGFGLLSAFFGAGSLLGALGTAYTGRVTVKRLLIGSFGFSVVFGALALSRVFEVSALLLIGLGFTGITFTTTANTLLQLMVPDNLRGRVMSLYFLLFAGSTPIGGMLIGTLSNSIGVPPTLFLCAVLCSLGGIGSLLYQRRKGAAHAEG